MSFRTRSRVPSTFAIELFSIATIALVWSGCTDVDLFSPTGDEPLPVFDDKLQLSGRICTTDPADVVFPLKVLFMIDTSQSMNVSDPVSQTEPDPLKQTGRARAIAEVLSQYVNLKSTFESRFCNTGVGGCEKGSQTCAACADPANAAKTFMCVGPDCCKGTIAECKGVPACPTAPDTNGACIPTCDPKKDGCQPGQKNCADCPDPGDQCLGGICGHQKDPGVEFAIMRFGAAKQVLTRNREGADGFTNDVRELVSSVPQVSAGGSVTDYEGALSMAYKVISADIALMKEKNAAAIARTRYVVIMLTDGKPYPAVNDEDDWKTVPCNIQSDLLGVAVSNPNNCTNDKNLETFRQAIQEYNVPARVLKRVKELIAIKALHKIGDIKLHTSFLSGGEPSYVEDESVYLLKQMAELGGGTFRSFPNGESINFLHVGFSSLRRVFKMKNLLVTNVSARPTGTKIIPDSDGDGIDDLVEQAVGTNPVSADTDKDGFSDTLEYFFRSSGWDALDPTDADCPVLKDDNGDKLPDDTDGDGLLDCEERFLGTSANLFDSDADGIPDGVEVKFGTNPVVIDVDNDLDFDGMPNGDEIRLHSDPRADDAAHRSRTSYRYDVRKVGTGIEEVALKCTADAGCPTAAGCTDGYCRCPTDDACSTAKTCATDAECIYKGERCLNAHCTGTWLCKDPKEGIPGSDKVCTAEKHVTCYNYTVENITLVTPKAKPDETQPGWNQINLYMGQVPFDNPLDFGNFTTACVRAWYNTKDGSKLPATGKVTIPEDAWFTPQDTTTTYAAKETVDKGATGAPRMACGEAGAGARYCNDGDACIDAAKGRCAVSKCLCPDGKIGTCR